MARVIQCPACGASNALHEMFCVQCHTPLTGAAKTFDPAAAAGGENGDAGARDGEDEPAAAPEAALAPVREPAAAPAPAGDGGVAATRMEPGAAGPRAILAFDWGEVAVGPGETVGIGRDPEFCRHARELDGNMYVSRRHAEFFLDGEGFLTVRHLSRTNPTYHNGTPIVEAGESRRLAEDDRIGFSRHVSAVVRLG